MIRRTVLLVGGGQRNRRHDVFVRPLVRVLTGVYCFGPEMRVSYLLAQRVLLFVRHIDRFYLPSTKTPQKNKKITRV